MKCPALPSLTTGDMQYIVPKFFLGFFSRKEKKIQFSVWQSEKDLWVTRAAWLQDSWSTYSQIKKKGARLLCFSLTNTHFVISSLTCLWEERPSSFQAKQERQENKKRLPICMLRIKGDTRPNASVTLLM